MVFTLPENLYSTDPNFTTLFRLLDDFDSYSREVQGEEGSGAGGGGARGPLPGRHGRHGRGLNPRFDIRETEDAYELYGELPGIERKDVHIELTEPNAILVRGHVDRGYDAGGGAGKKGKDSDAKDKEKEKDKEEGPATVRVLQRERQVGDFAREFSFPGPLQELEISARLENGILKVVAPKSQPSKGRRIEIT
ncbi:HSP20-like chaperone [Podospora appendiculata]|uniref:HSP20-like chaperone n=1 Tax=Podospora appendiculata TaxID=314037 RepID=A0AAE0XAC6_9PEZI|nr:HSP20-like chaperone [Podospora appendiculata]